MRKEIEQIFLAGVERVLPENLIRLQMRRNGDTLHIAENSYRLPDFRHIYVLAAGKAAASMAKETENLLGDAITAGHVVTKYGHGTALSHLSITEAGHPIPDAEGVKGTQNLLEIARKAGKDDLLLCLISGGASALMVDVPEGATLEDLKKTNDLLVRSGANIAEINTVRKHLSKIKGGGLAKTIYPATTASLILSDVIGDQPEVIASGPTAGDPSTFAHSMAVIEKYSLHNLLPTPVLNHLQKGLRGSIADTPKPDEAVFECVRNHIVGSNRIALESAARKAREFHFETHIVTDRLEGDCVEVADFITESISKYRREKPEKPVCLLFGGEPTLKVSGNGLGGRNQHLALYLTTKIGPEEKITVLCAGTDGTDGPTHAAGAVIDRETHATAKRKKLDMRAFLSEYDSFHFFQQAGGHILTGNTRTNVMDIIVALIE